MRNNHLIKGYILNHQEFKLEQYADDSIFILDGSQSSFSACLETIDEFSAVSGLSLNPQKSELVYSGPGPNIHPHRLLSRSQIFPVCRTVSVIWELFSQKTYLKWQSPTLSEKLT